MAYGLRPSAHSLRNAISGSTFEARRAGMTLAMTATTTSSAALSREGHRVARRDFVQERADERGEGRGAGEPDGETGDGQQQALRDDLPDDVVAAGAEGDAHADLARALGDDVGQHAVDPHGREQQRQTGERGDQHRAQARLLGRLCDERPQRLHAVHRNRRIDRGNTAADRRHHRVRIGRRADQQRHRRPAVFHPDRQLLERRIQLHERRLGDDAVVFDVADDADDLAPQRLARRPVPAKFERDAAADRIVPAEQLRGQRFVDDDDRRRPGAIARVEDAAVRRSMPIALK